MQATKHSNADINVIQIQTNMQYAPPLISVGRDISTSAGDIVCCHADICI